MYPNLFEPPERSLRPLRARQSAAIEAIRQAVKEGHKRIVLQAPTGFGKTLTAAHLIASALGKGNRPLFTCPAITLIDQTVKAFEHEGIRDIGVIQAKHERTDWKASVQVASVQTLIRRPLPDVHFILIDECFPAGTIITTTRGPKPIEQIAPGDRVANAIGTGYVISLYKSGHIKLIKVRLSNGTSFRCTPDHPIFTSSGWKKAGQLEIREGVFSEEDVSRLRCGIQSSIRQKGTGSRNRRMGAVFQQANMLWAILRQEATEPDASTRCQRKGISGSAGDEAHAKAGRQRKADAGDSRASSSHSGRRMGAGIHGEAGPGEGHRIPDEIQSRFGASSTEDMHRARWWESFLTYSSGARSEKGRTSSLLWVESVEIEELARAEPVYNLHVSGHPSYFANGILVHNCHIQFDKLNERLDCDEWKDKIVIGLSATPWAKGMGHRWTKLIVAATVQELINEGFLSTFQVYVPADEYEPDLSNVRTVAGDFEEKGASAVMSNAVLVADVVKTWKERAAGLPTFLFAVDRAHAKHLQEEFENAGVPCGYIDAFTEREQRTAIFGKMRRGEFSVIASVGCLTTGVDEDVRCIVDAAPTKSEIRHVQKIGRGLRTADGKDKLLILDHAGNTLRLGMVTDIHHNHLDTHKPGERGDPYDSERPAPKPRKCQKCHALVPVGRKNCPVCGEPVVAMKNHVQTRDGELVLMSPGERPEPKKGKKREYTMAEKQEWYSSFLHIVRERGQAEGAAAHRYREKFGVWPNQLKKIAAEPIFEAAQFDKHCRIRYAKSKQKAVSSQPQPYRAEF